MAKDGGVRTTEPQKQAQATTASSSEVPHQPNISDSYADLLELQGAIGNRVMGQVLYPSNNTSSSKATQGSALSEVPPIVHEVISSPGEPLDPKTRVFMESHFKHDFSQVQVHTNTKAAESAQLVNATAYAVNQSIVFSKEKYQPKTIDGQKLIAHELAHVVQQYGSYSCLPRLISSRAIEHEAALAAEIVVGGGSVNIRGNSPAGIAREVLDLPAEGIDMPWVGRGESIDSTDLGYLRDAQYFWVRFQSQSRYPHLISPGNRARINSGSSPVVDSTWVQHHPEHSAYMDETLTHHHVGQGSRAVPLPDALHRAHSVFHPQRRVVGSPTRQAEGELPPRPTRADSQARIDRFTRSGRIRGEGISPTSPPIAPSIPPASEVAGVPPAERYPTTTPRTVRFLPTFRVGSASQPASQAAAPPVTTRPTIVVAGISQASGQERVGSTPQPASQAPEPTIPPTTRPTTRVGAIPPSSTPGRVTPGQAQGTPGQAPSPGGTTATVGVPNMSPIQVGSPLSLRGERRVGGARLALQGVNFVLNWVNNEIQEQRVRAEVDRLNPEIARCQQAAPNMGALVIFHYSQVESLPDSSIQPGAVFIFADYGMGQTRDEAREQLLRRSSATPRSAWRETLSTQEVWTPPPRPASIAEIRTPFRRVALATFANEAVLQDVRWQGAIGFDDERSTSLNVRRGLDPKFIVLAPPVRIIWFSDRRVETSIPIVQKTTASGEQLNVVDLDPTLRTVGFDVTAAMVFPADNATDRLFSTAPETLDNNNYLRRYANLSKVRWVRPENIHVI